MSEFGRDAARAAEFQWKAKSANSEDDKHSFLALADSWLQTAKLHQLLESQEQTNQKAVA